MNGYMFTLIILLALAWIIKKIFTTPVPYTDIPGLLDFLVPMDDDEPTPRLHYERAMRDITPKPSTMPVPSSRSIRQR